jgi:guanylate kinase
VVVVSAPSGTGKSTVGQALMGRVQGLRFSISYTTRDRREGERDGVDYHFVDAGRFCSMRDAGGFLEWAEVHGQHYGTARDQVQSFLDAGHDVLLDVDVQGAEAVQQALPDAVLVFLLPPSYQVLRKRLEGRGTPPEDLTRRLDNARDEMDRVGRFDYLVVNDVLEEATEALEAILLAERSRRRRRNATWRRIRATFPDTTT